MALALGVGAGGVLFAITVEAARAAGSGSAALLAALQALGVFMGAHLASRSCRAPSSRRAAAAAALAALATIVLVCDLSLPFSAPLAVLIIGWGVGASVALVDGSMALRAQEHTRGSAVVGIALFSSIGAAAAPFLAQVADGIGAGLFAPSAIAFCGAAALGLTAPTAGHAATVFDRRIRKADPVQLSLLAVAAPLLFGIIDNGVLALAPAQLIIAGADGWTAALVGVAAAAGAAIVQIGAVKRLEFGRARAPAQVLKGSAAIVIACLLLLALLPGAGATAFLLIILGVAIDLVYGAALVICLTNASPGGVAKAAGLFVAICALGEIFGPLIVAGAETLGGPGTAPWAIAFLAAALTAVMIALPVSHATLRPARA